MVKGLMVVPLAIIFFMVVPLVAVFLISCRPESLMECVMMGMGGTILIGSLLKGV